MDKATRIERIREALQQNLQDTIEADKENIALKVISCGESDGIAEDSYKDLERQVTGYLRSFGTEGLPVDLLKDPTINRIMEEHALGARVKR